MTNVTLYPKKKKCKGYKNNRKMVYDNYVLYTRNIYI